MRAEIVRKMDNFDLTVGKRLNMVQKALCHKEGGPATSGSLKPSQRGSTPRPFAYGSVIK